MSAVYLPYYKQNINCKIPSKDMSCKSNLTTTICVLKLQRTLTKAKIIEEIGSGVGLRMGRGIKLC